MVKPTRLILDAFNITWHEASSLASDVPPCQPADFWASRHSQVPGEAEAELASMNCHGIVDAVLTDDSDVFAFGARTVLRKYV